MFVHAKPIARKVASEKKTGSPLIEPVAQPAPAGITLSSLLARVRQAVSLHVQPAWTFVDVTSVRQTKHVWLEVAQRDESGSVLAKCGASIWGQRAAKIVSGFEQATGVQLAAGIKLLVLAKPVFHPSFGFSIEIEAIDPAFTLGELEAKKRAIREQLKAEGLFELQGRLSPPWDYRFVLVVAPEGAAGLGDFQADALKLTDARLCKFVYRYSLFQGEAAAASIAQTIESSLQGAVDRFKVLPDAVVIIRGGGAVNDLAWLNDYHLARTICELPVPVLTGIGHERDSTIVDEVAHASFDTPSKVVGGIQRLIVQRAHEAQAMFDAVATQARNACLGVERAIEACRSQVASQAHAGLRLASQSVEQSMQAVQSGAASSVHKASSTSQEEMRSVQAAASAAAMQARASSQAALAEVRQHVVLGVARARQDVEHDIAEVSSGATRAVEQARAEAQSAIREITGQGPSKTLQRGFAMVRSQHGATITSAAQAQAAQGLQIVFHDGAIHASASPNQTQETDRERPHQPPAC